MRRCCKRAPHASHCMQAVETAAPTGQGLAELEEAILLQAELMDLKATQGGPAEGTTVEARQAKGQGPVATVIVKRGSLRVSTQHKHSQQCLGLEIIEHLLAVGMGL